MLTGSVLIRCKPEMLTALDELAARSNMSGRAEYLRYLVQREIEKAGPEDRTEADGQLQGA